MRAGEEATEQVHARYAEAGALPVVLLCYSETTASWATHTASSSCHVTTSRHSWQHPTQHAACTLWCCMLHGCGVCGQEEGECGVPA